MFFKKKIIVATHNGNFHLDDVFSVALISIFYGGKIKILRTRDENIISKADFIVDVGFEYNPSQNKFDHHQEGGAGKRESGINYSAFGILWKEYGEKICGSKRVADILDRNLAEVIDANDNGVDLCKPIIEGLNPIFLVDIIKSLKPTWKEDSVDIDKVFVEAVALAKNFLLRLIKITKDNIEAEVLINDIYKNSEDKRIIVFGELYFPRDLLANYPGPLFAVYKEKDGSRWRVTTLRESEWSFKSRKNFPESWWGKSREDLISLTGISDVTFCRNGGVFAGAETREGAIKLAKLAVEA